MHNKEINIVVTGDISINILQWKTYDDTGKYSWQSYQQMHSIRKLGEDFLLSKLVALATNANVLSPKINCKNHNDSIVSLVELGLFPETSDINNKNEVYRISEFLGYSGPAEGSPKLYPIENDNIDADLIILDDENNGFNNNEEYWPLAIKSKEKHPIIIYKTNNLVESNNLWNHIEKYHINNTIVVINADDLRAKGVNVSKGLSWERTALDFVWQMNNNPKLSSLAKCRHLIVLFGVEGAIHYKNGLDSESQLYFLTDEFEGDFIKDTQGKMYGLTSSFVAGLARQITACIERNGKLDENLCEGIRDGIIVTQKYFMNGFGNHVEKSLFPDPIIFSDYENKYIYKERIQDVNIRKTGSQEKKSNWYIIRDKNKVNLEKIAYEIVNKGEKSALKFMPIAYFGNLKTVDRTEIEGYRSIKNLMSEYLSVKNAVRPLCISVFGTPGSGKSFGITEVASSIAPEVIEKLDFNLSQFKSTSDLIAAFHKARDFSLKGKLPLVFFDEFDSEFEGRLGWLKYFLAPMQDGVFREGDAIHPIGKAIFVFVGGTSSTFNEFTGEEIEDEVEKKLFLSKFRDAKGPDFISRLRGYVDILGPNQTKEWDQLFIIRRAMLLRSLIEWKMPHLINTRGEAQIDHGVIRALLKIPEYKHESRSMEAILEMSMLSDAKKWEQYHLPSKEQLKLHVDEEQFTRLLMKDEYFSERIEDIATELYYKQHYYFSQIPENPVVSNTEFYDRLTEIEKNYILQQIRYIPKALRKANYDVISVKKKPETITFSEKELNILGEYEYNRIHRTHSQWHQLPDDSKEKILKYIESWPEILANSNLKIEKLKYYLNVKKE
ncbi:hypothetical protein [Tissierella sp. Yu-01]|uniref:hypothetical protein n=1 Tax=Tissierella sp. Yu-01 TaxID=3035694 RepID=UPI00240E7871|nr:hypothetical protein [Tissierella sp. Yu-01]WFA10065.1 hypothetical protein P3962_05785 [Tissierella sp. Yu-01]